MATKKIKRTICIEPQYCPGVAYFSLLSHFDNIIFEINEFFQKQTYRNRCEILTHNGKQTLSIPVNFRKGKKLTKNIKIDNSQTWKRDHIGSIRSAYGKSPFFIYYSDFIFDCINKDRDSLTELNVELNTYLFNTLGWEKDFSFTDKYIPIPDSKIFDARDVIHPKKSMPEWLRYVGSPYEQMFGKEFVDNLSVLDVLFNVGTAANEYIGHSTNLQFH